MPIKRLYCLLNRHRPVRDKIAWSGLTYVSKCKFCGTDIRRLDRGGWRKGKIAKAVTFEN